MVYGIGFTTLFLQPAKKNQQIKILHPTKQWLIGVNYLPIVLEVAKAWPILASKDGLEASQVAEGSDPAFLQDPGNLRSAKSVQIKILGMGTPSYKLV